MNSNKRSRGRGGRRSFNTNPNKRFKKQKPLGVDDKLAEKDVGITEYMNNELKGFVGIIKARFSDFHVNEIDIHNNIAKLTNTDIPEAFREKKIEPVDPPTDSPIAQISNNIWTDILKLKTEQESDKAIYILAPNKEDRTLIHTTIKSIFRQHFVSNCVKQDDNRYIELRKVNAQNKRQDNRFAWPVQGEYVHFLVYKEHIDTIQTAMKLANALKMKSSSFTYAGVKDRRAKTTQWFCVKKVNPTKLFFRVNKVHHNIKIGNVKFEESALRLGDLNGNLFRIALRYVTADSAVVNACLENVKKNGFINYYGLQRFGADKYVPTHTVGIKLLQGNFKEACELILKVKDFEDPDDGLTKAKKKYFETKDAKTALLYCDNTSDDCIESKLLEGLAKCNRNDYTTALESIARNMRLLYIHAFQSFVWNNVTSKRIREFGLDPVLGDLVLISESKVKKQSVEGDEDITLDNDDSNRIQEVELVTEDNISKYTICDVVLPLPGFDIIYPENLKSYYQELLSEHGLCIEMPKQKVATYTLSGNYRHIIQRATNMSWSTLRYNDQNDTLIRSDFEEILKHDIPVDQPNGKYKAVIVSFQLPAASYATMCLREALRMDTSTAAHANLMETLAQKDLNAAEKDNIVKPKEDVPQENSLLADKEKFEAFKRSIFGNGSEADDKSLKRKLDDDDDDGVENKKIKCADSEEMTVISMQASMP